MAIVILMEVFSFKVNVGGVIKVKIREVLVILERN